MLSHAPSAMAGPGYAVEKELPWLHAQPHLALSEESLDVPRLVLQDEVAGLEGRFVMVQFKLRSCQVVETFHLHVQQLSLLVRAEVDCKDPRVRLQGEGSPGSPRPGQQQVPFELEPMTLSAMS